MSNREPEADSRSGIRAVRWIYYLTMTAAFPLWLLVTFILVVWLRLVISPLTEYSSLETTSPSLEQTRLMGAACIAFFLLYPATLFGAHRITRGPWVVFAAPLLPVLAFCHAVTSFPITDSNSEQIGWLAYVGSLAVLYGAGTIAGLLCGKE